MVIKVNDRAIKLVGILCAGILISYAMLGLRNLLIPHFYFYELGKITTSTGNSSFLGQVVATHKVHPVTTTKPLQIEYTVLKVPAVK